MATPLLRYGDAWVVTATAFLSGALWVAAASAKGTFGTLFALGGALLLAMAVSAGLVRWREAQGRSGVFLRPRQREALLLAAFLLTVATASMAILRRPSPPPPAAPPHVADSLTNLANDPAQAGNRDGLIFQANLAGGLEEQYRRNETTRLEGGPAADEAAEENREIERFLTGLERGVRENPPASPGEPPKAPAPKPSELPPLPRLSSRGDDPAGRAFSSLVGLLAGPLGPLLREILGLSLGSGYRRQVETVAQTMAGGTSPSVTQIEDVLGAADADRVARVEDALRRLAEQQLARHPEQLRSFREHLEEATRPQASAARQILTQLERDPTTPGEALLGFLGTSPPDHFASPQQQREVEKALRPRFEEIWQEHFADLPVQESLPEGRIQ